jgi:pectinesterase
MRHFHWSVVLAVAGLVLSAAAPGSQGPGAIVTVRNPIDVARPHETVVLAGAQLKSALAVDDIRKVHVRDERAGQEILAQAIDVDDDGVFDELAFQADLGPAQTRTFALVVGARQVHTREQFKAYGRFVRERRDDFAWENDVTAHRMYGAALETWAQEPLTSSAVDVWLKRTTRLVINDWYMVDDYHRDLGEGADLYSAGKSRGCGGSGIWADGRLYSSANFRDSRVLANGPLRVMFELTYAAWDAGGQPVSEVKRVTLDAGEHLSRFESRYTTAPGRALLHAAGMKKHPAGSVAVSREGGVLRTWEPVKDNGAFGCAVIVDPAALVDTPEADGNALVVIRAGEDGRAVHYAGAAWDRAGQVRDAAEWDHYLQETARRLRAPLEVSVRAAAAPR